MEYKYVKPLECETFIADFETYTQRRLPKSFKRDIKKINGGRPSLYTFDTSQVKECCLKCFLSFNPEDKESIWSAWKSCPEGLIPFAIDNFGNYIVFGLKGKVLFINHENSETEMVADSYEKFINSLY